jgi:hypothetical protein
LNDVKFNQLYEGFHLYGSYDLGNYDFYKEKITDKIKLSDVNSIGSGGRRRSATRPKPVLGTLPIALTGCLPTSRVPSRLSLAYP